MLINSGATEQTISARWVAPVSSPPIADGIVSFANGRLAYVGPADGRRIDQRFDNAILLPGLVNSHTHLDLTGAVGKTPPQPDFCTWLQSVIAFRRSRSPEQVRVDVAAGVALCLAAGTTLIGDIALGAYNYDQLNAVAFQELIGLSEDRCNAAIAARRSAGFIPAGVSPHAPYSFRFHGLDDLPNDVPLAMHISESLEEMELLRTQTGPMRQFLDQVGAWDATGLAPNIDAIFSKLAKRRGSNLLVHCNYVPADVPTPRNATIVYCPRTHAASGHPLHPFREFLARGTCVVLGTDSLASNPDLSILEEARFVHRVYPDFDETTLLKMITTWPSEALGQGHQCGTLEVGKRADMAVFGLPANTVDPAEALFSSDTKLIELLLAAR